MELMELTFVDEGKPVLVNPMQVLVVRKSFYGGTGSEVCMATPRVAGNALEVQESLDEVAVKWARAMRVEEVE